MAERLTILYNKKPGYDIVFQRSFQDLWTELEALGCGDRRLCIITDSRVDQLYSEEVLGCLEGKCRKAVKYVFPQGEEHKNLDTVKEIYRFLVEEGFDRRDMLLALGGGVTGDMTGYAAATYMRGIDYVQIPTTLLAQADSSIGGKTGVDFDGYKNMVGAFKMPRLVYMNLGALQTLEERQYYAGFAEVMKHGLIKDAPFYQWLIDPQLHREKAGGGEGSGGAGRPGSAELWAYHRACHREGKKFHPSARGVRGPGGGGRRIYFLETGTALHG